MKIKEQIENLSGILTNTKKLQNELFETFEQNILTNSVECIELIFNFILNEPYGFITEKQSKSLQKKASRFVMENPDKIYRFTNTNGETIEAKAQCITWTPGHWSFPSCGLALYDITKQNIINEHISFIVSDSENIIRAEIDKPSSLSNYLTIWA